MARLFLLLILSNAAFFFWQYKDAETAIPVLQGAVPVAEHVPMLVLLNEADGEARQVPERGVQDVTQPDILPGE